MSETVYYAIGDVHGELEKLGELLRFIGDDAASMNVRPQIVFLGDLIDRGPDSRGVVEVAKRLTEEQGALALLGNHEQMLLTAYDSTDRDDYAQWSFNGGDGALDSYKRVNGEQSDWRDSIDREHVKWLRALPTIWRDEDRDIAFVHAGIDPLTFPNCREEIRIWTRSRRFFESENWPSRPELEHLLVVHGHTPTENARPENERRRINVDTGACFGGPLTSVVLAPEQKPRFLFAGGR